MQNNIKDKNDVIAVLKLVLGLNQLGGNHMEKKPILFKPDQTKNYPNQYKLDWAKLF